jgi:hypothetical protein
MKQVPYGRCTGFKERLKEKIFAMVTCRPELCTAGLNMIMTTLSYGAIRFRMLLLNRNCFFSLPVFTIFLVFFLIS